MSKAKVMRSFFPDLSLIQGGLPAQNKRVNPVKRMHVLSAVLCGLALLMRPAQAASLFTETFNYTVGSGLAGKSGGTGFSGAWTGGDSTIVAGIGGGATALQVGSSMASRTLLSTQNTSGQTIYLSYIMNSSNFSGGNYTGLSLWQGSTENMFLGIPWNAQSFGFDAHGGNGTADIKTVNFTPSANTSYLVVFGLLSNGTSGKTDIKLWATSDLSASANTLLAAAPNAELLGSRNDFSFDNIRVAGNYAGALKLSGLSMADTGADAISVSVASVPEPSALSLMVVGLGGVVALRRLRRKAD